MFDTDPRVLPHVEGVRNPGPFAIGESLLAEIKAQGLNVKCLSKIVDDVSGGGIKYPRLLSIVNGTATTYLHELATICNVLAIRLEDLVMAAGEARK